MLRAGDVKRKLSQVGGLTAENAETPAWESLAEAFRREARLKPAPGVSGDTQDHPLKQVANKNAGGRPAAWQRE